MVTGYENKDAAELTIPSEVDGQPVTELGGGCFMGFASLKSVLVWYGLSDEKSRWCLLAVPVMQFLAMLPDGLMSAGVLNNTYGKDVVTYVISAGIAYLAAKIYNSREDQVAHFQVEKLRARRRR